MHSRIQDILMNYKRCKECNDSIQFQVLFLINLSAFVCKIDILKQKNIHLDN